jgi:hypothetical protein
VMGVVWMALVMAIFVLVGGCILYFTDLVMHWLGSILPTLRCWIGTGPCS